MSTSTQHSSLQCFYNARAAIKNLVLKTPVTACHELSTVQTPIYLKLESLQPTGSFKVRGAACKINHIKQQPVPTKGVIAVSTGNHGCAVAYMAARMKIKSYVCVSENVPNNKLANIRRWQPELTIAGASQDEAEQIARQKVKDQNLTLVHPFDDWQVITGQGTISLELIEQLPNLSSVIVPLSGGGLLGGIAYALKQINPDIYIIGVSMEQGAAMYNSIQAGKPVSVNEYPTLADSLQGGVGLDNSYTFALIKQYVDDIILLSEQQILHAMAFALDRYKLLLEGAAVVGLGALLHHNIKLPPGPCALVVTGNNVDYSIVNKLKEVKL